MGNGNGWGGREGAGGDADSRPPTPQPAPPPSWPPSDALPRPPRILLPLWLRMERTNPWYRRLPWLLGFMFLVQISPLSRSGLLALAAGLDPEADRGPVVALLLLGLLALLLLGLLALLLVGAA